MRVKIEKSTASGRVSAPPSKSMAHRYLICAAMSAGSRVTGLSLSDDIKATLEGLKALGAQVQRCENGIEIGGFDFAAEPAAYTIDCNESGSTLRFLLPLCLLFEREITLKGTKRLFERSLSVYEQICNAQGLLFDKGESSVTVKGRLKAGKYSVRGDISSQFITGLIFALSTLSEDSEINIEGKIESGSYLGLTLKAMGDFGVRISRIDERTIYIKGNQYCKRRKLAVEGDYSNAAFLEALNLFGGNASVRGLSRESAQGDRVYRELFPLLSRGTPEIDITDCPDLAPVLMAVAAAKNGARLVGTARLKIKESDRGEAMREELAKLGAEVYVEENEITVLPCALKSPTVPIYGHNDHRIVMAMAVLLSVVGGEISGAQAVSKSFPDFFETLSQLGVRVEILNDAD